MDQPVRIALANLAEPRLADELRTLPIRTEVHLAGDLYEGTERLLAVRPDLLFVGVETSAHGEGDLHGALRLLHHLLPATAVILVAPATREVALRALAERTGARLLPTPYLPGELMSAIDHALRAADRPRDEVFLDLARGFADEINNPLLFLMGHLQLLQLQLDPAAKDLRDQLDSALAGAARIHATVDRIRLLARAAAGPRQSAPFDLFAELAAACARHLGDAPPVLLREPEHGPFRIVADAELLQPALDLLVRVAGELRALGCGAHFVLTRLDGAIRLRLSLTGAGLEDWRLPRSFEPYYLNRLLRGSSHGLSLFLVQTAVHAHRGLATARRQPDGAVAIDLQLAAAIGTPT